MNRSDLLALYDQQLRAEAEVADAHEVERIGPLVAATFPTLGRGFVTYRHIPRDADLDGLVTAVVDHYSSDPRVDHVEWKTRGHDRLPGLHDILLQHGFIVEEPETVMAGPVEAAINACGPTPHRYTLVRASTPTEVRDAEALAGRVFGDTVEHSAARAEALVARFLQDPNTFEMWLVRDRDGSVVCSGRVDFVVGTQFAGLWGGACDVEHRGRGLYRTITAARARSAQAKGHRYLHSDCTEFSRPILERAGLVPITTTTPALWQRSRP